MSVVTDNIKKIINFKGLKQKFVAEQLGFSERKLSDIINERKVVDPDIVLAVCEVLEVTPNDLFGYDRSV